MEIYYDYARESWGCILSGWVAGAIVVGSVISSRSASRAAGRAVGAQQTAAERAIEEQRRASEQGLGFLEPFAAVGQRGVDESGFLADPQAQFDFLQDNPLFQLALENANQSTLSSAASSGRLSAGDTLERLSNNVLLSSQPLIDRQRQDIFGLLNIGQGVATSQANTALGVGSNISNLFTDIGAVQAGGIVGSENARQQGIGGILQALIQSGILSGQTSTPNTTLRM